MSARYGRPVAYRNTERVIPPCHHWSWSSTKVASDHFTTRSVSVCDPGASRSVRSNSEARCESLPMPTSTPSRVTISTLSAAPTCSTIRRPAQAARDLDGPLVDAGRVQLRDLVGRLARERHLDVGVVRQVERVLPRPAAGDLDVAPAVGGRSRRPAGAGAGSARCRRGRGGRGAARCASARGRRPSPSGRSRAVPRSGLSHGRRRADARPARQDQPSADRGGDRQDRRRARRRRHGRRCCRAARRPRWR